MAARTATSSTLTTDYKQKTLVLRKQAQQMQSEVETKLQTRAEEFKEKHRDAPDEEIDAFIDEAFKDVKKEVNEQLEKMKGEVKKHAPKKPERSLGMSEEEFQTRVAEYEREKEDYLDFIGFVTGFLKGLAELFADIFVKIRQFFQNLWNWIKQALKDIAEKVLEFVNFLKKQFASGLQALFGC